MTPITGCNGIGFKPKKVFLCFPIKGRKDDDIQATIKAMTFFVKEYLSDLDVDIVHNYEKIDISKIPHKNKSIYMLSKAIEIISDVDCLFYINDVETGSKGYAIKKAVALSYGIPTIGIGAVESLSPDLDETPCCPICGSRLLKPDENVYWDIASMGVGTNRHMQCAKCGYYAYWSEFKRKGRSKL